jgi:hypothetical protein
MLILKCLVFFYIMHVINLSLESLYLFKKTHENLLDSFRDFIIYIESDSGKRLVSYYVMMVMIIEIPYFCAGCDILH